MALRYHFVVQKSLALMILSLGLMLLLANANTQCGIAFQMSEEDAPMHSGQMAVIDPATDFFYLVQQKAAIVTQFDSSMTISNTLSVTSS